MPVQPVNIGLLQQRLLALVRRRVHNGEHTERGLARVLGISQSQIHNVLKGARTLHIELADRMMAKLELTIQQLLTASELEVGMKLHREGQIWHQMDDEQIEPHMHERERLRALKKPAATSAPRGVRRSG